MSSGTSIWRYSRLNECPELLDHYSNIFSIIWKAVKQADKSFEKGVFKGATHAGNWIPSAIVRIAEEEKQYEYDRLKGSKICQISEVIYSLILDDPDGSFKIPLPRYTAEVMRPVLGGISSEKTRKSRDFVGRQKSAEGCAPSAEFVTRQLRGLPASLRLSRICPS